MKIERKHTVAVAIDYQEKLVPVMQGKEELLEHTGVLLSGLRELEIPIVITQQYTKGLGMTVPEVTEAAGTSDYLEKLRFSAFQEIETAVHRSKYVIVCGIEAHICVLQTVIELRSAGYIPVLVADCISSRKEQDMKIAIERARDEGAIVTTCESLLFELLDKAGTPESKKIQRLVK